MCGRFGLDIPAPRLAEHYGLAELPEIEPRYNIAPGQEVLAVRTGMTGDRRESFTARFGLKPPHPPGTPARPLLINARAETAADKPSFRSAWRQRRCLIPASGFYEWQRLPGGKRQPHYFRLRAGAVMTFAGLWEETPDPTTGAVHYACTILTVAANELVSQVHARMPAVLAPQDHGAWLAPGAPPADLLAPAPASFMESWPVSSLVNAVSAQGAALIQPIPTQGRFLF